MSNITVNSAVSPRLRPKVSFRYQGPIRHLCLTPRDGFFTNAADVGSRACLQATVDLRQKNKLLISFPILTIRLPLNGSLIILPSGLSQALQKCRQPSAHWRSSSIHKHLLVLRVPFVVETKAPRIVFICCFFWCLCFNNPQAPRELSF